MCIKLYFEPEFIKIVLKIAQNSFTKSKIFPLLRGAHPLRHPPLAASCLAFIGALRQTFAPPLLKSFRGPCSITSKCTFNRSEYDPCYEISKSFCESITELL